MNFLLKNIRIYSRGREFASDLRIRKGKIIERAKGLRPKNREQVLDFSGYLALPGLINSHDHLGLNLFPRMGSPPYPNFYVWAEDIYHPDESPIWDVLQVSLADRLWWSAYKNLISGVTTVVHHDPYYQKAFKRKFPIKVMKNYGWAHSLGYDDNVLGAFKKSRGKPFIIHAAEGMDGESLQEIARLEKIGVLGPNTVIIHGIALTEKHIQKLSGAGVSVIWCPASNQFLYGKNAPIPRMKGFVQIALGTDSTLSGSPTLLDEMRVAHSTGMVSPTELLEMITTHPACIFDLRMGTGSLEEGVPADILLLPDSGKTVADTLLHATPRDVALVLVDGEPRLSDKAITEKLGNEITAMVEGTPKWIYGDIASLRSRIQQVIGSDILSKNPLWNLIKAVP